ncbi:MAG: hypothetical protein V1871_07690 [Planctomycetota bacterium]
MKRILLTPLEASNAKELELLSSPFTLLRSLRTGLIVIILVMVLVGCVTQGSSRSGDFSSGDFRSGDFTIVNNTKYTLNINYQGPHEGWMPLTRIAAGKSWKGKRPTGSRYWYAYGCHINRCVFNPISPWVIE